jgi:hypothetical protein
VRKLGDVPGLINKKYNNISNITTTDKKTQKKLIGYRNNESIFQMIFHSNWRGKENTIVVSTLLIHWKCLVALILFTMFLIRAM